MADEKAISKKEVAERLGISIETLKKYVRTMPEQVWTEMRINRAEYVKRKILFPREYNAILAHFGG